MRIQPGDRDFAAGQAKPRKFGQNQAQFAVDQLGRERFRHDPQGIWMVASTTLSRSVRKAMAISGTARKMSQETPCVPGNWYPASWKNFLFSGAVTMASRRPCMQAEAHSMIFRAAALAACLRSDARATLPRRDIHDAAVGQRVRTPGDRPMEILSKLKGNPRSSARDLQDFPASEKSHAAHAQKDGS